MIDPKFNELPDTKKRGPADPSEINTTETTAATTQKPRAGLSVNDTIASDANLSVGSRGVDTSGTRSGAGAGAGGTSITPGSVGESPEPNIAPGPRGSGMTPMGSTATGLPPTETDSKESET